MVGLFRISQSWQEEPKIKQADEWLDEFFYLVRPTWVLPYPSNTAFITTTKTSRGPRPRGRPDVVSAV